MRLILASSSPRRAELLTYAGIPFDVAPAPVDETPHENEEPTAYVLRVARDKAAAAADRSHDGRPILAADTTVAADGWIMGKPRDVEDARAMLQALSGRVHDVHTGVVLRAAGREFAEVVTTRVRFVPLSAAELDWYLASGEADGKAGAYGIQGRASRFIDRIEGSWANVVGLPIDAVHRMLRRAGHDILT